MRILILLILSVVALSACNSMPHKKDTPMAAYNKLIVRNINWKETATSEIEGDEVKEYVSAQPKLAETFRTVFGNYIQQIGFFDSVTYGDGEPDSNTLILYPKIYTLSPGVRGAKLASASYTGLLVTADGKHVGSYNSDRRVNRPLFSTYMGSIEKLITELAEDAASRLPLAR